MLVSPFVSTAKSGMLVSMKLSEKYAVPPELALLYDFVNSIDQRRYVQNGVAHPGGDEIETPRLLEAWMRERGLLHRGEHVDASDHQAALELRKTLRDYLSTPPEHRPQAKEAARHLTAASRKFPLALAVSDAEQSSSSRFLARMSSATCWDKCSVWRRLAGSLG